MNLAILGGDVVASCDGGGGRRAQQLLGGNWDPYPIDMSFQPPCMVLSHIGLAQPGKITRVRPLLPCTRPRPRPPTHQQTGAPSATSSLSAAATQGPHAASLLPHRADAVVGIAI